MFNTNKEKQALKKIKNLQKFLNKYFPETLPEEKPDRFKFVEALQQLLTTSFPQ